MTWCLSTYLGAANDALRIFLEKRMIPKFSAAPGIYEEWRLNKGINGRRGTHLAYLTATLLDAALRHVPRAGADLPSFCPRSAGRVPGQGQAPGLLAPNPQRLQLACSA